jgi:hypothetical protein
MNSDLGKRRDSLIFPVQSSSVLVLKIAEGSAQRQIAVDALITDEMFGFLDAVLLNLVLRLVVLAQCYGLTASVENGTAVASVGTENLFRRDEDDAGGRTGILGIFSVGHLLVDIVECLNECFRVFASLERRLRFERLSEVILRELSDVRSAVTVEYTK